MHDKIKEMLENTKKYKYYLIFIFVLMLAPSFTIDIYALGNDGEGCNADIKDLGCTFEPVSSQWLCKSGVGCNDASLTCALDAGAGVYTCQKVTNSCTVVGCESGYACDDATGVCNPITSVGSLDEGQPCGGNAALCKSGTCGSNGLCACIEDGKGTNSATSCCSRNTKTDSYGELICAPKTSCIPAGQTCEGTPDCCNAGSATDPYRCEIPLFADGKGRCVKGKESNVQLAGEGKPCDPKASPSQCQINLFCSTSGLCTDPNKLPLVAPPAAGPAPITDFKGFLQGIYKFLYPIGIGLGAFFTAKAGYKIATSEGEPTKLKEGQEDLIGALAGSAFILLSIRILSVIINSLLGTASI